MLRQRVVTALVLLLVLGTEILVVSPQGFALTVGVILLFAAWEWAGLAGLSTRLMRSLYVLVTAVLLVIVAGKLGFPLERHGLRDVLGLAGLTWAVALLWVMGYPGSARLWGYRPVLAMLGWLVLLPCGAALVYLREAHGLEGLLYVVAVVCSADIGAYFAGRAWGKRKLAPAVSPGKSWAGFWGGLACALLLGGIAAWQQWFPAYTAWQCLLATGVASLASVLGDLLESMVKRFRGVKDSGKVLPGHGGVLDRLDSLTAAAPVFALFWLLWGQGL
ncbi:MAG: phosphatidate cytidylyltransferase [Gammaproteobacteria bacterium]|nr:MAG: phosphatidate cytidylyltransferase [Gammaproteobacteria bacterium]